MPDIAVVMDMAKDVARDAGCINTRTYLEQLGFTTKKDLPQLWEHIVACSRAKEETHHQQNIDTQAVLDQLIEEDSLLSAVTCYDDVDDVPSNQLAPKPNVFDKSGRPLSMSKPAPARAPTAASAAKEPIIAPRPRDQLRDLPTPLRDASKYATYHKPSGDASKYATYHKPPALIPKPYPKASGHAAPAQPPPAPATAAPKPAPATAAPKPSPATAAPKPSPATAAATHDEPETIPEADASEHTSQRPVPEGPPQSKAPSIAYRGEYKTFMQQVSNRSIFPVALAKDFKTNRKDLFELWRNSDRDWAAVQLHVQRKLQKSHGQKLRSL